MPRVSKAVRTPRRWLAGAFLLALLAGCGREGALEGAASEPATAVTRLARQLAGGDLAGYARSAVPPDRHQALARAWADGDSLWPLTGLPLDEQLPALLGAFAAPRAEASLRRSFDSQLAGQDANLRQTAQALGLFGERYVTEQAPHYSEDQRQHYRQVVQALSRWAMQAPLGDRERAYAAIDGLAGAVRASGLDGAPALAAAGMEGALAALSPVQQQALDVLAGYGLDLRASLSGLQAGLLDQDGDSARVRVEYTLAGQPVHFEADMRRIEGRWYLAQNLADADLALERARQARDRRQSDNAGATERAEGEEAGRPQTHQQMAPGP